MLIRGKGGIETDFEWKATLRLEGGSLRFPYPGRAGLYYFADCAFQMAIAKLPQPTKEPAFRYNLRRASRERSENFNLIALRLIVDCIGAKVVVGKIEFDE
jgi:hypothetical protein